MLAPVTLYEPTVGSLVTLRCLASSGTPTQVRWFKAGQPIIMFGNSGMSGATVSNPSLTITSVRMADAGFYICQGSDGFVTRNTSAINLSPKGKLHVSSILKSFLTFACKMVELILTRILKCFLLTRYNRSKKLPRNLLKVISVN